MLDCGLVLTLNLGWGGLYELVLCSLIGFVLVPVWGESLEKLFGADKVSIKASPLEVCACVSKTGKTDNVLI